MNSIRATTVNFFKSRFSDTNAVRLEKELHEKYKNEDDYIANFYEYFQEIQKCTFQQALQILKNGEYNENSQVFKQLENQKQQSLDKEVEVMPVLESEMPCKNSACKSKNTYTIISQTRSGDEGSTLFVMCRVCKSRYKVNN